MSLASCIMPTAERRRFVPAAIQMFLAQSYTNSELVILDDGKDSVADCIPDNPRIRYYREPRRSLGMKHNRLVELARGEYILHWADDDYHAPWRVEYQVKHLQSSGSDLTAPTHFLRVDAGR